MNKSIELKGQKFFYKIDSYDCGEYGATDCYRTKFYKYNGVGERKKYWFFGPTVKYDKYKRVFTLQVNIENPSHTKEEIRSLLKPKLVEYNRKQEIEKGEII
jgi:hypothetical protein